MYVQLHKNGVRTGISCKYIFPVGGYRAEGGHDQLPPGGAHQGQLLHL
jgi:hypothetical protein